MILFLPFSLPDATPIGDRYAMQTRDGFTYYFFNLEPFDCHPADDRRAMLLRVARLHVVSGVRQADIMCAFDISRPTVARAVKRYRERGEDAFFEPRRGRGRTVVDAEMADKAAKLLASGISGSACARQLGIPVSTFHENRHAGVFAAPAAALAAVADAPQAAAATDHPANADAPQAATATDHPANADTPQAAAATDHPANADAPRAAAVTDHPANADAPQAAAVTDHPANASHTDPAAATDRATRDARDKQAPMGRAARDVEGRMLASAGLMTEAKPVFAAPAHAVAHGGVLAALPMLLREGLLGAANRLFRLPDGFYGLTTILLFVAFMTLARVRNPEGLRYQAPGEWGAILGLDRCPETKTLRRKFRLLTSAEHTVRDWQSALARTWATEHDDDWATLAVDGHVKVYAGRKGRLPKHFVARQKLCMPASVSYWINALGGTPLLCLHKALDPKLVKAIEQDVVPHLQHLGVVPEAAPDLTRPDAGAPALTLVFDREGWSPDLFKRLARRGIACITWHKNFKGEDWPEEDFRTLEVLIHGPAGTSATTVDLAEKPIVLRNGLTVRQIRRRLANGRQVPVITTHPQMPLVQVAGAMFSRWSQENFFKYMREQFNLDSLPTHDLEPLDPDAQVVNPVRRALEKTIRRLRSRLATARNRLAEALQEHHRDTATRLQADANALAAELDQLTQQRADSLTHVRAGDLPEQDKLDALPVGGRLFLDLVRMIAYRAETRMMVPVITTQGKKPNARRLLRALLTSDANIIPQPAQGILRIQLLGLGSDACDRMLAPLVEELNATRTIYPGTDLTLVYELAGDPPPAVSPDSG